MAILVITKDGKTTTQKIPDNAVIEIIEQKSEESQSPENGTRYFFFNDRGDIIESVWNNYTCGEDRFDFGNFATTRKAMERKRDIVKRVLKAVSKPFPKEGAHLYNCAVGLGEAYGIKFNAAPTMMLGCYLMGNLFETGKEARENWDETRKFFDLLREG